MLEVDCSRPKNLPMVWMDSSPVIVLAMSLSALWLLPVGKDNSFIKEKASGTSVTFKTVLSTAGKPVVVNILCKKIRYKFAKNCSLTARCPTLRHFHFEPAGCSSDTKIYLVRASWHLRLSDDEIYGDDFLEVSEIVRVVKKRYRHNFLAACAAVV